MKTIIEMAREVGLERGGYWEFDLIRFKRFADLVRADERAAFKAEVERLKADSDRLAYVYSGAKTDSNALVEIELRLINGDVPTIEEVRIAIDTAIRARGNT